MVRFVDDRQVRRSLVGSSQVRSVAFGAMGCVELGACHDQFRFLWLDGYFGADDTSGQQEQRCHHYDGGDSTHELSLSSSGRRHWALTATTAVEAPIRHRGCGRGETTPAQASDPAAKGMVTTL